MLNIDMEVIDDIIILHIEGVISASSMKSADHVFFEQLKSVPEIIALNCRNLSHIDSYGINHLFKFSRECASKGVKLTAFNIQEQISTLFEVTKLHLLIPVMTEEKFFREYIISDD